MPRFGDEPEKWFASIYEGDAPWDIGGPQPALVELISGLPLLEPVLDLGSGSGDHAIWIAQQGFDVVGLELIPSAVALSKRRASSLTKDIAGKVEFVVGDALHPGTLGREFGSIVDSGFYHLFEPDVCERFASELKSALTPGGRYYILAFAIDFPIPDVPRGITEAELSRNFSPDNGWKTLALCAAEFSSRMGSVPAVCGCFERV